MSLTMPGSDVESRVPMDVTDSAVLCNAYRTMYTSRVLDEYIEGILATGTPVPHFHGGIGQEAVSVGAVTQLRRDDPLMYTHRGYAALLAKGVSLRTILLDLFMKAGGSNGGFGAVMHVSQPELGIYGREGAFGVRFPIAVGLAMAARRERRDSVVVCLYGEACGARGPLYEALNMAVLWKLPIVLVAENNGWSFSSRTEWLFPQGRMSRVWRGFDIPVEEIDGNDVEAVRTTVGAAVDRARSGGGPAVIEALTYRVSPHIWYDKDAYRPATEVADHKATDPLPRARHALVASGVTEAELVALEEGVHAEFRAVIDEVGAAPLAVWPEGTGPRPFNSALAFTAKGEAA
jgi:acetoin:2,6-dichlorophenolindophenol oxidoreductase subunit alpha